MLSGLQERLFSLIHENRLIYNTCWEDPRLDRELLGLSPESTVVAITSAGCNVLDYLLDGPAAIHAVDVNYRQNAVLSLKMALFRGRRPPGPVLPVRRGWRPGVSGHLCLPPAFLAGLGPRILG